jgi:hypothetical protein
MPGWPAAQDLRRGGRDIRLFAGPLEGQTVEVQSSFWK